jgi:hypothetical protein
MTLKDLNLSGTLLTELLVIMCLSADCRESLSMTYFIFDHVTSDANFIRTLNM